MVEATWRGHITGEDVTGFIALVEPLLPGASIVLADARGVTSFDAGARRRSVSLVTLYRDHGIRRAVTVTSSAMLRIAGSTVARICSLPLSFAETMEQAESMIGGEV